jgi:putative flippase GtrA
MLDFLFVRYLVVGLVNTFAGLSVIFSCKALLGMGDIESNFVGYGGGIVVGFILNKCWTFEHSGGWGSALARYMLVLVIAYLANLAMTLYVVEVLSLNSYFAQTAGVVPYTLVGYLGGRFFVFTGGGRAPARPGS